MDEGIDTQAIVRALARYLRSNPHASDTAEGIRLWWLDQGEDVTMDQIQAAIDRLLQGGIVEEVRAADGRRRYRRIASDAQLEALLRAGTQG